MTVKVTKDALNLREKLSELDKPSGIAGQDILKADTPQEVFNYIGAGRRNLIINGAMQVWQRGTSASTTGYKSVDRFSVVGAPSGYSVSRSTDVPDISFPYSANISNTSGSFILRQTLEDGYARYGDKIVTFSCWVKIVSGSININISDKHNFEETETGVWKRISTTGVMDGTALDPHAYLDIEISGAGEAYVTGVQLEVGSVATPFEHRSYGEELALCQRYYFKMYSEDADNAFYGSGFAHTTLAAGGVVFFPVEMRARPTALYQSGTASDYRLWHSGNINTNCSSVPAYSGATRTSCRVIFTVGSGLTVGGGVLLRATNTNSYLAWDVEL